MQISKVGEKGEDQAAGASLFTTLDTRTDVAPKWKLTKTTRGN